MGAFTDLPPEILEKILQYVSSEDIKCYRRVSKYCRNSTLPFWNKFVYVKITDAGLYGDNSMTRFMRLVRSGDRIGMEQPFKKIILDGNFAGRKLRVLDQFLIKCGPQIKSFNLKDCEIQSAQCIQQILFQACPNMSDFSFSGYPLRDENLQLPTFQDFYASTENRNLSSLTIFQPSVRINGISFWMDIFRRLPCLKRLECICATTLSDIFTAIATIRKEDPSQLKLSEKRFDSDYVDKFPCDVIQILTDPGLNFKILNVALHESTQLNEILHCHASSLKVLQVSIYPKPESDPLKKLNIPNVKRFDILKNLTVLEMTGDMSMVPLILKSAPNLKTLAIRCCPKSMANLFSESWMKNGLKDLQLTKCTELELDNYVPSAQMLVLANLIPNVKKLKMLLDDDSFAEICKNWPNLISLKALNSSLSEAGITGLDDLDVQIINSAGENGCVRPATVPRANISALKNLQTFVMRYLRYEMGKFFTEQGGMSYCSIKHGFQQAPSLRNVQIQCTEVSNFARNEELLIK